MDYSHGLWSWTMVMDYGHGWSYSHGGHIVMDYGHGLWSWTMVMDYSHGLWSWTMVMDYSHEP